MITRTALGDEDSNSEDSDNYMVRLMLITLSSMC